MRLPRPARFALSLASACFLWTGAAVAQAYSSRTQPAPALRSIGLDAAALTRHRIRSGVEAVVLGRITLGLSVGYTDRQEDTAATPIYRYPTYGPDDPMPCYESFSGVGCFAPWYAQRERYREWTFDLALRYYPSLLSFRNGPARMTVYAGAFAGYHWRTWDEQAVYPMYMDCTSRTSATSTYLDCVNPEVTGGVFWPGTRARKSIQGVQPGAELGVRLVPASGLFVEAGGRFTLVTIDDEWRRSRPGDVEPRLVVAAGLTW